MTAQEILEKYDALAKSAGDEKAESFLAEQCTGYDEAAPEDLTGRAALYNELGGFYCAAGSYEKSETAFNKAKELLDGSAELRCSDSRAAVLENLGSLYRLTGQYDRALEQFNAVKEIYDEVEVPHELYAACISNIGQVYLDAGQAEEAEEFFRGALTIAQTDPADELMMGTSLGGMASARLLRGDAAGAAELLRRAGAHFNVLGGQYAEAGEYFITTADELEGRGNEGA